MLYKYQILFLIGDGTQSDGWAYQASSPLLLTKAKATWSHVKPWAPEFPQPTQNSSTGSIVFRLARQRWLSTVSLHFQGTFSSPFHSLSIWRQGVGGECQAHCCQGSPWSAWDLMVNPHSHLFIDLSMHSFTQLTLCTFCESGLFYWDPCAKWERERERVELGPRIFLDSVS